MKYRVASVCVLGLTEMVWVSACGSPGDAPGDVPRVEDLGRDVPPPPRDEGSLADMQVVRDVPIVSDVSVERDVPRVDDVPVQRDVPIVSDVSVERDVPRVDDVPVQRDVPIVNDVGSDVVNRCAPGSERTALERSTRCTVRPARGDFVALCGSSSSCPLTEAVALECTGGGYGPWLATSAESATVLFTDNVGGFHSVLLTVPRGGTARVDGVPFMTSATNALAYDRSGVRYLIAGEMPGAVLHRETPSGWTTQPLFSDGRSLLLVSAATMIDERRGYTLFQHLDRNAVDMAITRDGCWSREELSASALWRAQLSLDAMDRPWSTYYRSGTGGWGLYLRGPEREVLLDRHSATISVSAEAPIVNALPSSADLRPTVAALHADGSVHLHEPASGGTFSDRVLPSPGPEVNEGACPTGRPGGPPGGGCMGQTTCTQRVANTLSPFAAVRSNDGSTWVARLYQDWTTDYRLSERCGGPGCICSSEATARRGFTELRLQRVRGTDVREALRLTLSRTHPIVVDRVAMQVRGTTLVMVLPAAAMSADNTSLRYLEVDITLLR